MTYMIHNFAPNLSRLRKEKGISQTELAEKLNIGKQPISDYEKSKSYPTFATLDKIADFFKATPVQLFGTSRDIELEKAVLKTDEYTEKANNIIQAIKSFDDLSYQIEKHNSIEGYTSDTINNLAFLLRRAPIMSSKTDHQLYKHIPSGKLVEAGDKDDIESNYELAFEPSALSRLQYMNDDDLAIIDKLIYLTQDKPIFNKDGEPLTSIGNDKYVEAESGDEIARKKSPLQLLLDNKDELERLNDELYSKKNREIIFLR